MIMLPLYFLLGLAMIMKAVYAPDSAQYQIWDNTRLTVDEFKHHIPMLLLFDITISTLQAEDIFRSEDSLKSAEA